MLKDFFARQAAKFALSHIQQKSRFDLKNPSPLIKWGADLLGYDKSDVGKPYAQSIWVYRCMQQWERVAQVPLLLKNAAGEDVTAGTLKMLLDRPYPHGTTEQFLERIIQSLGMHGEYFILKEDGMKMSGLPKYLHIVSPTMMCLRPGDVAGGMVQSWSIRQKAGTYRRVPAEGVIHDFFPNPYDPHRGISPLEPAMASINADYSARKHNQYQMDRHGRITGIVSMKEETGEDHLRLLAKMWREQYEGKENAGKTAFLDGGAQFQQMSMTAKDMDWVNGQDINREEICAAFGISTIVAGGLKGATFSNYEQAMKAAWDETLMPLGTRITTKLNSELVRPNAPAGQYLEFDFVNTIRILQDDETAKVERYTKLVKEGKVTPTQAANLTQIDLGEPNPAHDVIWVTASEMPADFALEEPEPLPMPAPTPPPPAPAPEPEDSQDEESKGVALVKTSEKPASQNRSDEGSTPSDSTICKCKVKDGIEVTWRPSSDMQLALGKANLAQVKGYERKMEKTLKAFFYDQRRSVLERLEQAELPIGKDMIVKTSVDDAWVANLFAGSDWADKLRKRVMPILEAIAGIGVRQVIREAGGRFEPVLLDSFLKNQFVLLNQVNQTTADAVKAATNTVLESVLEGGIPTSDLMENLKGALKGVYNNTEVRRRTIARTETTRAWNGGRYEQMQYMGAPMKQWLTIMDGNERSSHSEIDGNVVAQDAEFANGLLFPGDPGAPPEETINCRCTMIPIFDLQDA